MKSVTIIIFLAMAITLFSTAYAASSKLQSHKRPCEYNEMGHIFVNFFIDLLSTFRRNIENDD